jgi:hypothetical protein
MLRDDLDRIRIEVEAKERLLDQKRKELTHVDGQLSLLGNEAADQGSNKISLEKSRQRRSNEIRILEETLKRAREEHAKLLKHLERVNAIKGFGSLPSPLLQDVSTCAAQTTAFSPLDAPEAPLQPPAAVSGEAQSKVLATALPLQSRASVAAITWNSIEIVFLSDHSVQIRNGTEAKPLNYAEFGFVDRRNGNPNRAWGMLRTLAKERGVIRDHRSSGQAWPEIEKRIQEIRKTLREYFDLSADTTDPIPYVAGTGYQARFKIGCGPSFNIR